MISFCYTWYVLQKNGALFWIMGLAGSGKSEIAKTVVSNLRSINMPFIWLDGDSIRQRFNLVGHTPSDRIKIGKAYVGLSQILVEQGFYVLLSSIGMNRTLEEFARESIENYYQIQIDSSVEFIKKLNLREIYHNETPNVLGKDLIADKLIYDLVIKNDSSMNLNEISKTLERFVISKLEQV